MYRKNVQKSKEKKRKGYSGIQYNNISHNITGGAVITARPCQYMKRVLMLP